MIRSFLISGLALCAVLCTWTANATVYVGVVTGTLPQGTTDTYGVFGGGDLSGAGFTVNFTYNSNDYVLQGRQGDPIGNGPTPGYSASVTINGVTAQQGDTQSYIGFAANQSLPSFFYITGNNAFYVEVDASTDVLLAGATTFDPGLIALSGTNITGGFLETQNANGDENFGASVTSVTSFSLTPEAIPEPGSALSLLTGLAGLAATRIKRRRRSG